VGPLIKRFSKQLLLWEQKVRAQTINNPIHLQTGQGQAER